MKLYSVTARWHKKGERRDHMKTAIILAESKEQAVERFKAEVTYPEDSYISAFEHSDGIYTLTETRTI